MPRKRETDPEIIALHQFVKALVPLTDEARQRVVQWAYARFIEAQKGSTNAG